MHGIEKGYFESGALKWETPYVDGNKHGIEKYYFETGALRWEVTYENGKEHGIGKYYDKDERIYNT